MYEVCVIGSGIVGKYLAHHLASKNTLWISSHNTEYTSVGEYKMENYLGRRDTWEEKATGLFSFPTAEDMSIFPFDSDTYKKYEKELKQELHLKSLSSLTKQKKYQDFVNVVESIFPEETINYFSSAHEDLTGPEFNDRDAYDKYWLQKKPKWSFSTDQSVFLHAEYFVLENQVAKSLVCSDQTGKQHIIEAKKFVVACHTPGTIALLARTFAFNHLNQNKSLGRYFADHAQTSLGVLLPSSDIPRTTVSSFCYQDRALGDISYRFEFHTAPPRAELVKRTRIRFPQYSQLDFEHCFARIVLVYSLPKLEGSRLKLLGKHSEHVNMNAAFMTTLRQHRKKLLPYVLEKFFQDKRMVLLNQHFPFFFAGHLTGGACAPDMVDDSLRLCAAQNVSIAGLATLPSSGLFNPTFAALVTAKHILQTLS